MDRCGLFSEASPSQTALMSTVSCPSDIKVCHCGHLMPEPGPAHNSSCRSYHLPPRLNLENLLSPSLLLLPCPSSHHISSRPSQRGHRGQLILPPFPNYLLPTGSFAPAAAAIYLLNLSLSVGAMPTAWPPHALARIKPVLDNFLTPVLMWLFWKVLFPDKRESHLALLSSRPFFRFQLLGSRSQVYSKRFDTRRHNHSFLAAFLTPLLQISSGSDRPARSAELSPMLIKIFGKRQLKR